MKRYYYLKENSIFPRLAVIFAAFTILLGFGRFYYNSAGLQMFTFFGIDNEFNGFQNFEYLLVAILPAVVLLCSVTLFAKKDPRYGVIPLVIATLANTVGYFLIGDNINQISNLFVNQYLNVGNLGVVIAFILLLLFYLLTILNVFKDNKIFVYVALAILVICVTLMFTANFFGLKNTFLFIDGAGKPVIYFSKFLE
ncbi:MAG: hypothetical protein HUJ61_06915, partial [Bacilli bacterium]|nr:hypothetical protein [Bacilli bacterium]